MSKSLPRSCLCCKTLFVADARNRRRQKYCLAPACRKASKAASQERWLGKPANQDYFSGSSNVERVQEWRKRNPGYWKRSRKAESTLQDLLIPEGTDPQPLTVMRSQGTLQDLLTEQGPVLVGLISQLIDSPLQEHIEETTRRLLSKGLSVLGIKPGAKPKGQHENQETGALCPAGATGSRSV